MHMVFTRLVGCTSIEMIFDEDWDILKREIARDEFVVESFDAHDGWKRLREGAVILEGGRFYHYVDTTQSSDRNVLYAMGSNNLFQGEVIEFTDEDEGPDL